MVPGSEKGCGRSHTCCLHSVKDCISISCWYLILIRILVESCSGREVEDVRAVANRNHTAVNGIELSLKEGM